MKKEVYVNRLSSFLPNTPVDNEHIEDFIGFIEGKRSRIKSIVLRRNGIKRRHYALDTGGKVTHRNSEMVVEAIKGLFDGNGDIRRVDTLCCATTTPDQLVPSHKKENRSCRWCRKAQGSATGPHCWRSSNNILILSHPDCPQAGKAAAFRFADFKYDKSL